MKAPRPAPDAPALVLRPATAADLPSVRALAIQVFLDRCHGYRELGSTTYEFEGERYENRLFARPLP